MSDAAWKFDGVGDWQVRANGLVELELELEANAELSGNKMLSRRYRYFMRTIFYNSCELCVLKSG